MVAGTGTNTVGPGDPKTGGLNISDGHASNSESRPHHRRDSLLGYSGAHTLIVGTDTLGAAEHLTCGAHHPYARARATDVGPEIERLGHFFSSDFMHPRGANRVCTHRAVPAQLSPSWGSPPIGSPPAPSSAAPSSPPSGAGQDGCGIDNRQVNSGGKHALNGSG